MKKHLCLAGITALFGATAAAADTPPAPAAKSARDSTHMWESRPQPAAPIIMSEDRDDRVMLEFVFNGRNLDIPVRQFGMGGFAGTKSAATVSNTVAETAGEAQDSTAPLGEATMPLDEAQPAASEATEPSPKE